MLFTYSQRALRDNWLNQTIILMLEEGMRAIIDRQQPARWPDIIPDERRLVLQNRSGIRTRLQQFFSEFTRLPKVLQESLLATLIQQSDIPAVFFNDSECLKIDFFPENIRNATKELFKFLFEKQLNTLKINSISLRDKHYLEIYENAPARICPFCGLAHIRAPGEPKNALDHYMPISKYPFAGSDLRNLPPMCTECNSDYKKDTDILVDDDGTRVRCIDPFNGPAFRVCLANSLPFAGEIKKGIQLPIWEINFIGGDAEQASSWDRIFKIRRRYRNNILDVEFRSWLEHFITWYVVGEHGEVSGVSVANSIPEYIDTVIQDGFADRAFLKVEVFKLLLSESQHPERGEDMLAFFELLALNS